MSLTLGGAAERLEPGNSSPVFQEVSSAIYHVISGEGHSVIDGTKLDWSEGDTFCVPTWMEYKHVNTGKESTYLYRCDDLPMMTGLGFFRKAGEDGEERYAR